MYSEADTFIGFVILLPSAHKYSNLGPALIVGQFFFVQNSVRQPKIKEISLKNSIVFTANHSFKFSP